VRGYDAGNIERNADHFKSLQTVMRVRHERYFDNQVTVEEHCYIASLSYRQSGGFGCHLTRRQALTLAGALWARKLAALGVRYCFPSGVKF